MHSLRVLHCNKCQGPIYMQQWEIIFTAHFSFFSLFSMHHFPNSSFFGDKSNYDGHLYLFPTVSFTPHLKIYDPGDRRTMRASSNDSEGTRLIYRSRSKMTDVPISNWSIGTIGRLILSKRTANFNLNVGDRLSKFIWLPTISGVPTATRF